MWCRFFYYYPLAYLFLLFVVVRAADKEISDIDSFFHDDLSDDTLSIPGGVVQGEKKRTKKRRSSLTLAHVSDSSIWYVLQKDPNERDAAKQKGLVFDVQLLRRVFDPPGQGFYRLIDLTRDDIDTEFDPNVDAVESLPEGSLVRCTFEGVLFPAHALQGEKHWKNRVVQFREEKRLKKKEEEYQNLSKKTWLRVLVMNGRNLLAMDENGLSDPFVKVRLSRDREWKKTRVQRRTLDPVFGERFYFELRPDDITLTGPDIQLQVYDYDVMSQDDPMGGVTIPVYEIPQRPAWRSKRGHWFPLEYDMDSALAGSPCQGELLVSLKIFVGDKEADMENDDGMIELSSSKRLLVHVDRANDLVPMDTNGSSDPYIILRFGKTQHKTRVAKRSLSPIYGEDFIFEDGKSTLLRLEVFDYDLFSEHDFMGETDVDIRPLLQTPNKDVNVELKLTAGAKTLDDGKEVSGSVKLRLRLECSQSDGNQKDENIKEKDSLIVTALSGHSLIPMDSRGTSDPYITFRVGNYSRKTAICRKTIDPVWNEECELLVNDFSAGALLVEVFDWDRLGDDDFMGAAMLKLKDLPLESGLPVERTVVLDELGRTIPDIEGKRRRAKRAKNKKTELLESQHPLGELKLRLQRVPPAIERYRLKVTVMEAEGVLAMDRSGTSDPYVEINVANQVQKTSIQKKTLAPVWRESFVFNVNSWAHGTRAFCKIWDWDRVGEDDFMGEVSFPLHRLVQYYEQEKKRQEAEKAAILAANERKRGARRSKELVISNEDVVGRQLQSKRPIYDHWFDIQRGEGKLAVKEKDAKKGLGRIRVCFERLPADRVWQHLTDEEREAANNVSASLSGLLRIRLRGARDLMPADINLLRSNSSDPYVVFEVDGAVKKSRVIRRSLNPDWDQSFAFEVNSLANSKLRLQVMDYDVSTAHDPLGHATVDLRPLHDLQTHPVTVPLEGVQRGSVSLDLRFLDSATEDEEEEEENEAVGGEFKEGRGVPTGLTLSSPPLAEIAASMQYGDDPRVAFDMEREVSKRLSTLSGPSETPMDTGGAGGTYGEEEGRSPRIQEEDARSILVGMAGGSSPCVHQGLVLGADFSPCGRRIVTAGSDHTLRIWNSLTGRGGAVMSGCHTRAFTCCRYSPDGQLVLAGNADSSLSLWDPNARALRALLEGHRDQVTSCDISEDGLLALSTAEDGQLRLWTIGGDDKRYYASGKLSLPSSLVVKGGHGIVREAKFLSKTPNRIIGGGDDMHFRLWDLERLQSQASTLAAAGAPVSTSSPEVIGELGLQSELLGHSEGVKCVGTAKDTPHLALTGSFDRTVRVWDTRMKRSVGFFAAHDDVVTSVKFLPGDLVVGSCSVDKTVRLYDLRTLESHLFDGVPRSSFGVKLRRREELGATALAAAAFTLASSPIPQTKQAVISSGAFLCSGDATGHVDIWRAVPGAFGPLKAAHFAYH